MLLHIVLFEPEIPPNTGNIIRLSANSGAALHLIEPLGFNLDDKQLKRAGLDYAKLAHITVHKNFAEFLQKIAPPRIFAISTKGKTLYHQPRFQIGDAFLFGAETRGLPENILENFAAENILRIPMLETSRSLNLSNAAAIIVYEAWRQLDFMQP